MQCRFTVIDKEEMQDCIEQVEFLWIECELNLFELDNSEIHIYLRGGRQTSSIIF